MKECPVELCHKFCGCGIGCVLRLLAREKHEGAAGGERLASKMEMAPYIRGYRGGSAGGEQGKKGTVGVCVGGGVSGGERGWLGCRTCDAQGGCAERADGAH